MIDKWEEEKYKQVNSRKNCKFLGKFESLLEEFPFFRHFLVKMRSFKGRLGSFKGMHFRWKYDEYRLKEIVLLDWLK